MNLVSIIIPYYRKKTFILETINSVLKQSYKYFEIIIVYDDQDKSDLTLIENIKKKDNRIKLFLNDKNLGAGLSRNIGIKNSMGSFIAFLDADDLWHYNKLEKQITYMMQNDYFISHTSYVIIDCNDKVLKKRTSKDLNYDDLIKSCDVGLSSVIIKRDVLKQEQFSDLKTKEDYLLWLKLAKKGFIFHALKENLTFWRKSKNSLSSSISRKLFDGYNLYHKHLGNSFLKSLFLLLRLSFYYLWKNIKS
jgi:teichuronic acid biosynthesis glycosyltransferase TuaG